MIEVFITDIESEPSANEAIQKIRDIFPGYKVTIDLEDREKIMRIDSQNGPVQVDVIKDILSGMQMQCRELDH